MKGMSNEIDTIVAALEQDGVVRLPMLSSAAS